MKFKFISCGKNPDKNTWFRTQNVLGQHLCLLLKGEELSKMVQVDIFPFGHPWTTWQSLVWGKAVRFLFVSKLRKGKGSVSMAHSTLLKETSSKFGLMQTWHNSQSACPVAADEEPQHSPRTSSMTLQAFTAPLPLQHTYRQPRENIFLMQNRVWKTTLLEKVKQRIIPKASFQERVRMAASRIETHRLFFN